MMDPELEEADEESMSARDSGPLLIYSLRSDMPVTYYSLILLLSLIFSDVLLFSSSSFIL